MEKSNILVNYVKTDTRCKYHTANIKKGLGHMEDHDVVDVDARVHDVKLMTSQASSKRSLISDWVATGKLYQDRWQVFLATVSEQQQPTKMLLGIQAKKSAKPEPISKPRAPSHECHMPDIGDAGDSHQAF